MEVREIDCEDVTGSMWLLRVQRLHSDSCTIELVRFGSYYRGIQPCCLPGFHFVSLANKHFRAAPHTNYFTPFRHLEILARRSNSRWRNIACYHSVQNILPYRPEPKNSCNKIEGIILHLVLYGPETWSLTLRQEHRLRVFENRVLRRIFGPKRDEVVGGSKLHRFQLSKNILRMIKSKIIKWAGHIACIEG
jgi:hypothetical protein